MNKKTKGEFCTGCNKLKYGSIEERINISKGKFVTKSGKKEVEYEKIIQKLGFTYEQVITIFRKYNRFSNIFIPRSTSYNIRTFIYRITT